VVSDVTVVSTTRRSHDAIQADIDRGIARLRDLRAKQADAHFMTLAETTEKLQALQATLDRLYEEKRAAHAVGPRPARPHTRLRRVEHGQEQGAATVEHIAAGLFADHAS